MTRKIIATQKQLVDLGYGVDEDDDGVAIKGPGVNLHISKEADDFKDPEWWSTLLDGAKEYLASQSDGDVGEPPVD